jgi:hypothetical protein
MDSAKTITIYIFKSINDWILEQWVVWTDGRRETHGIRKQTLG